MSSPGLVGVSAINYMFLEIERDRNPVNPLMIVVTALTKGNLPELSSQVRVLSVLFDPNLVVHVYNGAMQVLPQQEGTNSIG